MAESKSAQQVREITDKLEQGIKELFESERFKEYLRTMSKFYHYSFSNTLLIAMQKPEATYVAGYTSWQRNFDRQVMKGEKGIKILAPAPYKAKEEREKIDPSTQKPVLDADGKPVTETVEVMRPAFKVVSVFDISQTDGKELPDIIVDELSGSVENYAALHLCPSQNSESMRQSNRLTRTRWFALPRTAILSCTARMPKKPPLFSAQSSLKRRCEASPPCRSRASVKPRG